MSERNGDRARFQKSRRQKMLHRQRIQVLATRLRKKAGDDAASRAASLAMADEGGPAPIAD